MIGQINNLYNATFWALVQQSGLTHTAVEELLRGTVSSDKRSRFNINYNNELEVYKKGSVVFCRYGTEDLEAARNELKGKRVEAGTREDEDKERAVPEPVSKTHAEKMKMARRKTKDDTMHVDIIGDDFWAQKPWLRTGKPGQLVEDSAGR